MEPFESMEQQLAEYKRIYGPLPSQGASRKGYNKNSRVEMADERAKQFHALVEQGVSVEEIARIHGLPQGSVYQSLGGYRKRQGMPSLKDVERKATEERAEKFRSMKLQGFTLEEIGKMHDLSRERVRQIIEKYEKGQNLPSSIPASRKMKAAAKEADIEEYKAEQRFEKQKQYKHFVPSFQLDAHLAGRFLKVLGKKSVLYGFDGKAGKYAGRRKDGSLYPSSTAPTNVFITWKDHKHMKLHSWVLQQSGVVVEEGQHCHHIDGDITNNMLENLQVLSNVEHGRITMQEQMERGTIDFESLYRQRRRLTDEQVEEIRALYQPRMTSAHTLAETYGVSEATIRAVIHARGPYINVNPATCRVQKKGSTTAKNLRAKQIELNFGT